MSTASKFLDAIKRFSRKRVSAIKPVYDIPTVKFDASRVTDRVKSDIRKNIILLEEIDRNHFEQVYQAALRSISSGRDLSVLYNALMQMNIKGMTKRRAAEIAGLLNNKATALLNAERQELLGIKYAVWLYSGAPCVINPKKPTGWEGRQNAAHMAANGKAFDVSKGMFLDGKWTWPGVEPGCRCVSKSIVPGFS
jgi:uncharacterized protein with gpF-like domain